MRELVALDVPESAELLAETEQQIAYLSGVGIDIFFGFLHGEPSAAHLMLDLRKHPPFACDPAMREMTARDDAVRRLVMDTVAIIDVLHAAEAMARAFRAGPSAFDCGHVRMAVRCASGATRAQSSQWPCTTASAASPAPVFASPTGASTNHGEAPSSCQDGICDVATSFRTGVTRPRGGSDRRSTLNGSPVRAKPVRRGWGPEQPHCCDLASRKSSEDPASSRRP